MKFRLGFDVTISCVKERHIYRREEREEKGKWASAQ